MPHRLSRSLLPAGAAIAVLAWLPLLSALTGWAGDNPIGLGLLALGGSVLGLVVAGAGLVLRVWEKPT